MNIFTCRPDVPNTVILITDGVSNINARRTLNDARSAHVQGTKHNFYLIHLLIINATMVQFHVPYLGRSRELYPCSSPVHSHRSRFIVRLNNVSV